jgi:hypothetical protein
MPLQDGRTSGSIPREPTAGATNTPSLIQAALRRYPVASSSGLSESTGAPSEDVGAWLTFIAAAIAAAPLALAIGAGIVVGYLVGSAWVRYEFLPPGTFKIDRLDVFFESLPLFVAFVAATGSTIRSVAARSEDANTSPWLLAWAGGRILLSLSISALLILIISSLSFSDLSRFFIVLIFSLAAGLDPMFSLEKLLPPSIRRRLLRDPLPEHSPLLDIVGVSCRAIGKLWGSGVETVSELASANPVTLAVETGLDLSLVVDWVAQAQLRVGVPVDPYLLREHGVRTALDLIEVDSPRVRRKIAALILPAKGSEPVQNDGSDRDDELDQIFWRIAQSFDDNPPVRRLRVLNDFLLQEPSGYASQTEAGNRVSVEKSVSRADSEAAERPVALLTYDPTGRFWPRENREFVLDVSITTFPSRVRANQDVTVIVDIATADRLIDALEAQNREGKRVDSVSIGVRLYYDDIDFLDPEGVILIRSSGISVPCRITGRTGDAISPNVVLSAMFYYGDRYAGGAKHSIRAAESVGAAVTTPERSLQLDMQLGPPTARVDVESKQPDLRIEIISTHGQNLDWRMSDRVLRGLRCEDSGKLESPDPKGWYLDHFEELSKAGPEKAMRVVEGIGYDLYHDRAPICFRNIYPTLRRLHGAFSIQVVTNEPFIPWELMLPDGLNQRFLSLEHPIARIIDGYETYMPAFICPGRAAIVAPKYSMVPERDSKQSSRPVSIPFSDSLTTELQKEFQALAVDGTT